MIMAKGKKMSEFVVVLWLYNMCGWCWSNLQQTNMRMCVICVSFGGLYLDVWCRIHMYGEVGVSDMDYSPARVYT